jgi:hypothetical protein
MKLFRFVVAANAIVALYSLFEMCASVWEISRGATLFPEVLQVWFDFGHDQVSTQFRFSNYYCALNVCVTEDDIVWRWCRCSRICYYRRVRRERRWRGR